MNSFNSKFAEKKGVIFSKAPTDLHLPVHREQRDVSKRERSKEQKGRETETKKKKEKEQDRR